VLGAPTRREGIRRTTQHSGLGDWSLRGASATDVANANGRLEGTR
jgi:hypothetical protein